MGEAAVKGVVILVVREDGSVGVEPGWDLSRLEVNGAILEAWRLVTATVDLGWYRELLRREEAEAAAGTDPPAPAAPAPAGARRSWCPGRSGA